MPRTFPGGATDQVALEFVTASHSASMTGSSWSRKEEEEEEEEEEEDEERKEKVEEQSARKEKTPKDS